MEPPRYPMPSERSQKSASVVPASVVAVITAQYSDEWNRSAGTGRPADDQGGGEDGRAGEVAETDGQA